MSNSKRLDPTFVQACMERILPIGYKPEDYAVVGSVYPLALAKIVVTEVQHQLKLQAQRK